MADEKQPIVWHVDDEEEWRDTISHILTKAGLQVISTGSVAEAKKMIPEQASKFTVAILDNRLGNGRGEEIANLLRRVERLSIGIIGLASEETPWADIGLKKNAFEADELLQTVAELLGKNQG